MISDYDEGGRIYAMECCDNSNAEEEGKEETKTVTCDIKEGASKSFESSKSSEVIKSVTISSISETTITYKVTYCSYKSTSTQRFSESSTVSEYKSQSSSSSSSSSSCDCERSENDEKKESKDKGGNKSKGKDGGGDGKKDRGKRSGDKKGKGDKCDCGKGKGKGKENKGHGKGGHD